MADARPSPRNARIAIGAGHSKRSINCQPETTHSHDYHRGEVRKRARSSVVFPRSYQCVDTKFSIKTRVRKLAIVRSMESQESGDFEVHHEHTVLGSPMNVISTIPRTVAWVLQEPISGLLRTGLLTVPGIRLYQSENSSQNGPKCDGT